MDKWQERMKTMAGKLLRTGFFSVFFSNVLCKVLSFFGGMVVVRVLSKGEYGLYAYILNCYGMLVVLNDLGCNVASAQFCSEYYDRPEKFDGFFTYGYRRGMLFSGLAALLLALSPWFYPFRYEQAAHLTQLLCLMPFLATTNAFLLTNLRVRLENNRFAAINIFTSLIHYVVILPLAYRFGVAGAALSTYGINLLILAFSLWTSRGLPSFSWKKNSLELAEKRSFLKLAFASQLNNGLDSALMLFDVFLIGIFVADAEIISSYKVATTIPAALAFIPASVMVYVVPYFARNCGNKDWVRTNYRRMVILGGVGNLLITAGCILIAPWVIPLVFGGQYADAVPCFMILMVGYFFSATFRMPSANIIYTQRKVRANIIITVLAGCVNCVLDVVLILRMGSLGAALATTAVHIISSALSFGYLHHYLKGETA